MSKTVDIFVASHRQLKYKFYPDRKIVYMGDKKDFFADNIHTFRDDTGDNIASLNSNYCELTAIYWAYKNCFNADYIGFEHYRRNFYHHFRIAKQSYFLKRMKNVDVLHMQAWFSPIRVEKRFPKLEGLDYYDYLHKSLQIVAPEYLPSFDWLAKKHSCHYCNIFVMRRELMEQYLDFVFKVIFKAEEIANSTQKFKKRRWVGYIAELLLDIYIHHNKLKHKSGLIVLNKRYNH